MEVAVAGLADAAGLEQLLAWHWDLLVATAGAEHVTTVPAGGGQGTGCEGHGQISGELREGASSDLL